MSDAELVAMTERWLVDRLAHTAGWPESTVLAKTAEEAVDAWTGHITGGS